MEAQEEDLQSVLACRQPGGIEVEVLWGSGTSIKG